MKLKKSLVVFLVLIARICLAGIVVQTTQPIKSSELIDAAVNILSSCYGEHGPPGIVGNLPRTFLNKLWLKKPIPVIILHETERITAYDKRVSTPVKPQVYLFIAGVGKEAVADAHSIWARRWANDYAPVLVLSLFPNNKNGCARSPYTLSILLEMGFFNVNVLCVTEKKIMLRGGDIYTNQAPHPWRLFRYYEHFRTTYFMFWRPYRTDNEICLNLDYEKSKNLSGKKILLIDAKRTGFKSDQLDPSELNISRFILRLKITDHIWATLLHQMNATSTVQYVNIRKFDYKKANFWSTAVMSVYHVHLVNGLSIPGLQQSDIILMKSRGNKSQLKKILGIVDIYTQYCVSITLAITLIFFKYVANQHFIPAMLNIFRIICNTGFENLPDNVTSRTFLTFLFLCVVTIHGIFSGNLASLLTTEIPYHLPQTVQELLDLEYMIFIDNTNFILYTKEKYKGKIFPATGNCGEMVSYLNHVACIDNKYFILDEAIRENLAVSSKDLFVSYMGLHTIGRWPFVKTVSTILLRMSSAHIVEPLHVKVMMERIEENYAYVINEPKPPRVMNLSDLVFAFVGLGIGLVCAIISFIIEISINPIRSKFKKVRRYFRR